MSCFDPLSGRRFNFHNALPNRLITFANCMMQIFISIGCVLLNLMKNKRMKHHPVYHN